jgi:HD superfamily phosphohydrolase YqeK
MHPILSAADGGSLPPWAEAEPGRREHMTRVANLMEGWARELGLDQHHIARWRATAMLHDALRDADPATLRPLVAGEEGDLPGELLHGPAAAERLRRDGVDDHPLLLAIAWHTLGHPQLDRLGRALYLADYLEPGREWGSDDAARWRARMPAEMAAVTVELAAQRISYSLRRQRPLLAPTVEFWNGLAHG